MELREFIRAPAAVAPNQHEPPASTHAQMARAFGRRAPRHATRPEAARQSPDRQARSDATGSSARGPTSTSSG
eukprot:6430308-Prymnesium_polylepis.2